MYQFLTLSSCIHCFDARNTDHVRTRRVHSTMYYILRHLIVQNGIVLVHYKGVIATKFNYCIIHVGFLKKRLSIYIDLDVSYIIKTHKLVRLSG